MAEKVTLRGRLIDPAGRALQGDVILTATRAGAQETGPDVFAGAVRQPLDPDGTVKFVVYPGAYRVRYALTTHQGIPVRIDDSHITLTGDAELSALLWAGNTAGRAAPPELLDSLVQVRTAPGEVIFKRRKA